VIEIPAEDSRSCPGCGQAALEQARFCGGCGQLLPMSKPGHKSAASRPVYTAWRDFAPALRLWVYLLSLNLLLNLGMHLTGWLSPALELATSLVFALIVVTFCRRDAEVIGPLLRESGITARTWWLPLAVLTGTWLLLRPYFWLVMQLGGEFEGYLPQYQEHGWPLWTAYLMICVMPAIFEELAFRGFIQGRMERVLSRSEALILQAILFSVLHMSPLIFLSHFVLGLALGLVRLRTGSLYPGMMMHAVWNAVVLVEEQFFLEVPVTP
jgi:membrane protease YdiL (CAAX protease family)